MSLAIGKQDDFERLSTNILWLQLGNHRNRGIEQFQTFIYREKEPEIGWYLKHRIYLGDNEFVHQGVSLWKSH